MITTFGYKQTKFSKKNTEHDGGGWREEEDLIISHKYSTQHEGERVVAGKRERKSYKCDDEQ
jgi:hypothetical protein